MAKKRSTVYTDEEIWELAKIKAETKHKTLSSVIEDFLIDYIGNDYFIEDYVREIRKSNDIIQKEESKIEKYNKAIKELNKEMARNGKDEIIIGECLERINIKHSKNSKVFIFYI